MRSISSNPLIRERMDRYYAQQEAIARNAPGWAQARKEWAAEAEQAARRTRFEAAIRAGLAGETLTDDQRQHISEYIDNIKEAE